MKSYARYQAASDAGHWRAPLAVAKLTLEGWDPSAAADLDKRIRLLRPYL